MADILADEDVDIDIVNELRSLKHDVVCARTLSTSPSGDGISDVTVLLAAIQMNRIVLTFNKKDFKRLHEDRAAIGRHKGIIACSATAMTAKECDAIHRAICDRRKVNRHFYQQLIILDSVGEKLLQRRKRKPKTA